MSLTKLFEKQMELDAHILLEKGLVGQDLLDKKILALQVELGELANEHRGFKFWSTDQEPRLKKICSSCEGKGGCGGVDMFLSPVIKPCEYCEGTGYEKDVNPLLEEYVDCLHFILSIGLDLDFKPQYAEKKKVNSGLTQQFNVLFKRVGKLNMFKEVHHIANDQYNHVFRLFMGLGEMLGFTWNQIEQAYLDKNKINHQRQEVGY